MLAVGAAALALFLVGEPVDAVQETAAAPAIGASQDTAIAQDAAAAQDTTAAQDAAAAQDTAAALDTTAAQDTGAAPDRALEEATGTLRVLVRDAYAFLPKIGIALLLLVAAGLLARLARVGLRSALRSWERAEAMAALTAVGIWLVALGAALSVLAGDARALVGSVGLFGLALSWALQAPIESFTAWLLNSFRSYYRVGDRIAVGEVFGDVAKIDFLTTTVFEAGGPDKKVRAAQSTGALITFPNSEILRANIVNYTRDFPFVWDELTVAVAPESDVPFAMEVLRTVADRVVGFEMQGAAEDYARRLEEARLGWNAATRPEVYVAARDSWTDLTIRYLVPAREMRKWATRLQLALDLALAEEDVAARVFPGVTRSQMQPLPAPRWAREPTARSTSTPAEPARRDDDSEPE